MEIAVLGPVELRARTGEAVPVGGVRLRTLLTLLALDANRVVSADRLIDGVWGDDPPAQAANALQALVSRLRRTAPELDVEAAPTGYRLAIDADKVDVNRFVRLAHAEPAEALKLWRGDLDFPPVAQADAVRLEELRLTATKAQLGAAENPVPELEGLLRSHPLDEQLTALLMRALHKNGNAARALEVFETTRRRLADQLGVDPSAELARLHVDILRSDTPAKGNLPAEMSSFVGRDHDVRTVRELIVANRLVTLLGPGGSGKTRLSVEVGAGIPGEVWRIELAPVTDPAEVPQAIATALNLRGQLVFERATVDVPPLVRLQEAVASRNMLLILDNCEHLVAAAAHVADTLLRAAPGLRLLATSREPLGIPGERLFPVEPLALPPVGADATTASAFPSVRLLLDRAASFALSEDTTEPVVRVCRALDGMPLAIELAAARLRTLPIAVLADRLADRFRLLTGGSRSALPRHQTLRAVVDWSWDLLGEDERMAWRRFAVFHGGAEVTAAEQVCGTGLDVLGALVDKSLLTLGTDGRYRMLETIREYGLERLAEAGETESQRIALARWLLDLADRAEPQLRGREQLVWLRRLSEEHDNMHAAIRAAIDVGDTPTATAFVARLGWYWWLRGHRTEGALIADEVARMTGDADPEDLALMHTFAAINGLEGALPIDRVQQEFRAAENNGAGPDARHPALRLLKPLSTMFDDRDGPERGIALVEPLFDDPDPWLRAISRMILAQLRLNFGQSADLAEAELREALELFRELGERWGIGFALSSLGDMAAARGDFAQATVWQQEAIALVREVGIREDLPQLEVKLAHQLWMAGEHTEARRVLKLARVLAEEVGLPEVIASVEYGTATFARMQGDLEGARQGIARSASKMDNPAFVPQFRAMTRSTQALIEAADGDLAAARALHAEALTIAIESRDSPVIALCIVGLADLAMREGNPSRAAYLLGAADAVRGSRDRSVPDVERITFAARAALGDGPFDEAYGRACGMTADSAADLLRDWLV
ncbi:BTAD domain-containing putative transcriptional regulator [Actinoplanes sp. TBRC 11911]|uniref:ATP-binding protein n=1 Tax=Actinoplanes sp. TBRC 11911 TaxID=2729386 RepID=UPI00289DCECA|nr:BTAD domain-containing putative transcriptional regulator [Actinoplanes sp. TBRC 11911]